MIINDLNDVSNKIKGEEDGNIAKWEEKGLLEAGKENNISRGLSFWEWRSYQKDSKDA